MQYNLTGFTHDSGFRVFAFEGVEKDRDRSEYLVRAEFALVLRYGIRVQELPLLCRGILERRDVEDEQHTFTYAESDMCLYASACAARRAEALAKKEHRRPVGETSGDSWRSHQQDRV